MTFASRASRRLALALVISGSAVLPVHAETGLLLSNAEGGNSAQLSTGEQLLTEASSTKMPFAGRQIGLDKFVGIVGYANELAYVAVIEGLASDGNETAKPGHLIPSAPPSTSHCDIGFDGQSSQGDIPRLLSGSRMAG